MIEGITITVNDIFGYVHVWPDIVIYTPDFDQVLQETKSKLLDYEWTRVENGQSQVFASAQLSVDTQVNEVFTKLLLLFPFL